MLLVGTLLLLPWMHDPISCATYQRIQVGMTLAEAEAVVGQPSIGIDEVMDILFKQRRIRWVDPAPEDVLHDGYDWSKSRPKLAQIKCWEGSHSGLAVLLGDDGRIIGKRFEENRGASFVGRLRALLGL
jgi:hypothetical protein